jgi:hypothetical protein
MLDQAAAFLGETYRFSAEKRSAVAGHEAIKVAPARSASTGK